MLHVAHERKPFASADNMSMIYHYVNDWVQPILLLYFQ